MKDYRNQSNGVPPLPPMAGSPAPVRVQLSRSKGWRMPPNTVKVCRPGKWGNPYRVGVDGDAETCVRMFRQSLRMGAGPDHIEELKGKNLACWCPLDAPCHADVLLRLANASGHPTGPMIHETNNQLPPVG